MTGDSITTRAPNRICAVVLAVCIGILTRSAAAGETAPNVQTPQEFAQARNFVGTSPFILLSFVPQAGVVYFEAEYGRQLDERNALILAFDYFKYSAPMSRPSSDDSHYPGHISSLGMIVAYRRFVWKKLFVLPIVNPNLIRYYGEDGRFTQSGFQLLVCGRIGYHLDFGIWTHPWFLEAGAEINYWPISVNEPDAFLHVERKYKAYAFGPALNVGYKF
jgi:hypothetical protein